MKWRVGDIARVYDIDQTFAFSTKKEPELLYDKGPVLLVAKYYLWVETAGWEPQWWTKKQCRKLKVKK